MKRLAFAGLVCVGVVFSCFGSVGATEEVLVCHFPFNGNADDESGNGHNGTVNGATLTTDRFGIADSAYLFDGVNDYIEVPDHADLRLSQTDFTISTWFNQEPQPPSSLNVLMAKRLGQYQRGWYHAVFDGTSYYHVSGGSDPRAIGLNFVPENTWNHSVVTYDLATKTIHLYINGILDSVHANIPSPNVGTTASMMIGRDSELGRYWFHGAIDDIQIYNRMLSAEEVFALYRDDSWLSISIPEHATEGDGILSLAGTVNIATAPASNLVINLYSSDSGELGATDTVTILTGQTNATFDLVIYDDALLDGSQTAMITASAVNHRDSSAEIVVHDNETATLMLSLPQTTFEGAGTIAGALMVDPVPDEDVIVELVSNNPSRIAGRSVVIPAGQGLVSFTLDVIDDNLIDGMQAATVTAQVQNWLGSQASVFIFDNESTVLAVQVPSSAMEGDGVLTNAGTVSLSGVVTSDIHVILASSDTTEAIVPVSVMISNGASSASFDITIVDDADTDGMQSFSFSAQTPGFVPGSDMMEVQDNDLYSLAIDGIATNQPVLEPAAVNITAVNIDGMQMTWFTGSVALAASGDIGAVELSPTRATNFVGGVWAGDVAFGNIANNVTLIADDGVGHVGTGTVFNVIGSQIIITPDSLVNTLVVVDESVTRTMVISNAGNADLKFVILGEGIMDTSLIAHFPFNGNSVDESGNEYDGAVNGATLTTDRFGNADSAYLFDGTDDYIEVPDRADLRLSQTDFTISTWFNEASRTPSSLRALMIKRLGARQKGWFYAVIDGAPLYQVSGGYDPKAVSSSPVSATTWNHSVVTYDLEMTTIRLYINGVLDSVHANIPPPNATATASMMIGRDSELGRYWFHGSIDDIRLYNRMLSTDEVLALYLEDDGSGGSWLSVNPETGTVPPGSNATVEVEFDSTGFVVGDYSNAVLSVTCNDAFSPKNEVSASMWVIPTAPTMVTEPQFTLGNSNGVAWSRVDGPVSYLTEVVADTNSAPLQQSDWMASTNHMFGGLTTNVVYYYHVKASVSSSIGPLEGAWSDWVQSEQVADLSDVDGDGLPNWWEQLHFGGMRNALPLMDGDGDGQNNREEYIAGMDPTDPDSSFMVRTFDSPTNGMFVLGWDSVTGRVYSIYWQTNLPDAFQTLETRIRHPQNSYTDSVHNAESRGFYQVDVKLEQ